MNIYKRLLLVGILLGSSLVIAADLAEDFSDGDYLTNPTWVGDYGNFAVNTWQQLQSKVSVAATSYLSTSCTINSEVEWTFFCRITTKPTAYNYMRFYLISSEENPLNGDGWFVQIGGANKNITLCKQIAGEKETVIVHTDRKQLLVEEDNKVYVRVKLESGKFVMESKVLGLDSDYVVEGEYHSSQIGISKYFSIVVKNTAQTGWCYYADDIVITGETLDEPISPDLPNVDRFAGPNDVIINEIMFDPEVEGQEYVELYNRTDENLGLAYLTLTTLDSEGEYMKMNNFPTESVIPAYGYAVLCADATSLRRFHECAMESMIYSATWRKKLPNTGAMLCLLSCDVDTMLIDSVFYSPTWHHPLLEETKGVSLERIHPDLPSIESSSWQSASKGSGYATPAAENSQYQDIYTDSQEPKHIYTTQDYFSPNGDGIDDVCLIHYTLPTAGFVANIQILTANGLYVNTLTANELLSTSGSIPWDGRTARGSVADIGVYVLMCSFTHTTTGQIFRMKLPMVVSL